MNIRRQPDRKRADALRKRAETTLKRLKTTDILLFPSDSLTDYYDIIHKLMEAIGYRDGIKFRGEGAHQELIDHISEKHNLNKVFLQQLREYRNRISYEGLSISKTFIETNQEKIETIIDRLLELSRDVSRTSD